MTLNEGIVFWTSFPEGDRADPCAKVWMPRSRTRANLGRDRATKASRTFFAEAA